MGKITKAPRTVISQDYDSVLKDVVKILDEARHSAVRAVNSAMTAAYWLVGKRIFEQEQQGKARAEYGEELIEKLSVDLNKRFGRGFGRTNLFQMRSFFLAYKVQTVSGQLDFKKGRKKVQTLSEQFTEGQVPSFPLPWSYYVELLSVRSPEARKFYETEALRGGWTFRQLDRQIDSQFYERTMLSRNKMSMLQKGQIRKPEDKITPEEEIKDPYFLEFLNLKDEYSEKELEEALILTLENFLLELGGDFTFVGRQRRLRVGDAWYRIDLLFYHRRLRCLIIIDLKLEKFTHADAGQMHLYLNYAREHWMLEGENPPVGLILCAKKNDAVAHYALEGLSSKVLAAEYETTLPKPKLLAAKLEKTRQQFEGRMKLAPQPKTKKPTRKKKAP